MPSHTKKEKTKVKAAKKQLAKTKAFKKAKRGSAHKRKR